MESRTSAARFEQGQSKEPGEGSNGYRNVVAKDLSGRQAAKAKWRGGHISIRAPERSSLPASFRELAR